MMNILRLKELSHCIFSDRPQYGNLRGSLTRSNVSKLPNPHSAFNVRQRHSYTNLDPTNVSISHSYVKPESSQVTAPKPTQTSAIEQNEPIINPVEAGQHSLSASKLSSDEGQLSQRSSSRSEKSEGQTSSNAEQEEDEPQEESSENEATPRTADSEGHDQETTPRSDSDQGHSSDDPDLEMDIEVDLENLDEDFRL